MKYAMILAAAVAASAAAAQPPRPAAAVAPAADAERLALARTTAAALWPDGTYARMMNGSIDQMMDSMMASMMDVRVGDMAAASAGGKPADPELAKATFREAVAKQDPYFQERMRIMNRVMMSEMVPIMTRAEPQLREGLATAYARKFTAEQLRDLNRFFATPAGHAYASESMVTMMDPEVMSRIAQMMPQIMQAMPQIMEKVTKATAHLPLPKKAAGASGG